MKHKPTRGTKVSVYNNLTMRHKTKLDARARKKAEYLATLPKHPFKRVLYRMHPKRVAAYWFSRQGAFMLLKLTGVAVIIGAIFIGSLFAYYRRELDSIRPGEITKRVQTTVTKYYDRNGELLWEDKGEGDYKLVVDSKDMSPIMKEATIAIEDKDFYKHGGFSITGLTRAVVNNARGGSTQGGSTLTQQLVKNVFFTAEAGDRSLTGVPRKFKEIVLAIEVERMYNKDQILALYLNEVPYGGRRTGVESAAQTYFGKSAKDLTLPEAALLAGIPQRPTYYNPYTLDPDSSKALVARQHTVLNNMVEQRFITQKEADEAKKVAILDMIRPEISATENIIAPHFVFNEVRSQLEKEFGQKLVRGGGLSIKTTLDKRAQEAAERAVQAGSKNFPATNSNNMSLSSVDVETGQIIAMVGSVNFNDTSVNGQTNYATSPLQPGSSIKPFDYAALFKQRQGTNYSAGSLFQDRNIDSIYCRGNTSGDCGLANFTGRHYGSVTAREALGNSLNTTAVLAMDIAGVDAVLQTANDAGNKTYGSCQTATLASAIGGGDCKVTGIEHTNAYATLARGGVYKPLAYILEVKNSQGEVLKQWKDEPQQVLDPQIAYILSDILADANARTKVFGASARSFGFVVPNVKTASKTGTSDDGKDQALDNWMMSYSPKVAVGTWTGRHDGTPIGKGGDSSAVRRAVNDYMNDVHGQIYVPDGRYKANDWIPRPAGIQDLSVSGRRDIWPSWYKKPQDAEGIKMAFDRVSRKKVSGCTPERAKIEVLVQSFEDPVTKKKILTAPEGYDANAEDDRHKCDDVKPFVSLQAQPIGNNKYRIRAQVNQGTFGLQSLDIAVDGQVISSQSVGGSGTITVEHTFTNAGQKTISATVIDQGWYDGSDTEVVNVIIGGGSPRILP